MDTFKHIINSLHNYCTTNQIDYVIVGGFSVLVFGRTRMTMDIDVIIDHKKLDFNHFVNYFRNIGFDINMSDLEALNEQIHGSFFEKESMFRIDLKGVYSINERNSIKHSLIAEFQGVKARFDNPNQLIVHKLKYGSEQDIEDAIAVYIKSYDLIDLDLMNIFASNLGVEKELNEFLIDNESSIN